MKILTLSDTHNLHELLTLDLSDVDMIIHAGDFTCEKSPAFNQLEALRFLSWFSELKVKHKILIPGNHDTSIASKMFRSIHEDYGIHLLDHTSIDIEGIKIFGSPYTPTFGHEWAYNVDRNKLQPYWNFIPDDTRILVTHGPPQRVLDSALINGNSFDSVGDKSLMNRIRELDLDFHIFGHIHEDAGRILKLHDLKTQFINASVVDLSYKIINYNGIKFEIT